MEIHSWRAFRPRKKIFSPPPQIPCRHPPGRLAPPFSRENPPFLGFSLKNRPPRLPVAPDSPQAEKKKKYPKRPPSIATPAGTERSQIAQIVPKWLWESAKSGLELRCGSAEKVSCTGAREVCTGANKTCTGARDFFRTSAPELQTTFSTLPKPLWGNLGDLTPLRARRGRKPSIVFFAERP